MLRLHALIRSKTRMSDNLPGPHHCLSTARAVAEIIYRSLRAHCTACGGQLSLGELETCYTDIIDSFASGYDIFEARHLQCMKAAMSTAEMPFSSDRIVATVLRGCGEEAARQVFAAPGEAMDEAWLRWFFDGVARFIGAHVCADAEPRLTAAYIDAGLTQKGKFTLAHLLAHTIAQHVLRDCARLLAERPLPQALVDGLRDSVNAGAAAAAVSDEQAADFLILLSAQIAVLAPAVAPQAAVLSLAGHKKKTGTRP